MILAVIVASLLALSTAQKPKPPALNISSTFTATGEVEWHVAEETRFGSIMFGRDHDKEMGIEEANFTVDGKDDIEKVLQRYDIKMSIYVRGSPKDPSCSNQTRNGTLSPFWEWTDNAFYEGTKTIRNREYDLWSYVTGDVRLEVILEQGNKNTPLYFNRRSAEEFVLINIQNFSTKPPDEKVFEIPAECLAKD